MLFQKSWFATLPFKAELKRLFVTILCTVIVSMLLISCATSMKRSPDVGPDPLVVASCPELTPLNDASFGATTAKLVSVGGQYNICRTAALAGKTK